LGHALFSGELITGVGEIVYELGGSNRGSTTSRTTSIPRRTGSWSWS